MKEQRAVVKRGTTMEASGHNATVMRIRRDGVECILNDGRAVTVDFKAIEIAIDQYDEAANVAR